MTPFCGGLAAARFTVAEDFAWVASLLICSRVYVWRWVSIEFGWLLSEAGKRILHRYFFEFFSVASCINPKLLWPAFRFVAVNDWVMIASFQRFSDWLWNDFFKASKFLTFILKFFKKLKNENANLTKPINPQSTCKPHNSQSPISGRSLGRHHFVRGTDGLSWLLLFHLSQNWAILNYKNTR